MESTIGGLFQVILYKDDACRHCLNFLKMHLHIPEGDVTDLMEEMRAEIVSRFMDKGIPRDAIRFDRIKLQNLSR